MVNINELIKELSNPDEEVRAEAARVLNRHARSKIDISAAFPALVKSLYDEERMVRVNAAWAIKSAGFEKLPDENRIKTKVRIHLILDDAGMLRHMQQYQDGVTESVIEFLSDPIEEIQEQAILASRKLNLANRIGGKEWKAIKKLLKETDSVEKATKLAIEFRNMAKKRGDIEPVVSELKKMLGHENGNVRGRAAKALVIHYLNSENWDKIRDLVVHKDKVISNNAAKILQQHGIEKITDSKTKIAVLIVLGKIDVLDYFREQGSKECKKIMPTIIKLAEHANKEIRLSAINSIKEVAVENDVSGAVPALEKALKSEDYQIKRAAANALVYQYAREEKWNKVAELIDMYPEPAFMAVLNADLIEKAVALKEDVEITSEDFIKTYSEKGVLSSFFAISQFFHNYAKGCEEGNAPVLSEKGAEAACKLLITGQIAYWGITEKSLFFDAVRENKMDRIVAEDSIEKNLPEGWIKHMKKYVKAIYEGARDEKEMRFLGKFTLWEVSLSKNFDVRQARKVWDFFYVNNCLSAEDRRKYKEFVKGKKTEMKLRTLKVAN